jgi:hypothetical protein
MNVLVIALDAGSPLDLDDGEVLVVAPAVNSRLRHWLSDEDGARRRAARRADACVEQLRKRFALPVLQARRLRPDSRAGP